MFVGVGWLEEMITRLDEAAVGELGCLFPDDLVVFLLRELKPLLLIL
jgi:hypothetical protein